MPESVVRDLSSGHDDIEREQYNRGVIELLSNPHEALSEAQYSALEEVPVTLEEPWSKRIETTLCGWLAEAEVAGEAHKQSAYRMKARYRLFTFVVLLWSAIILVVNDAIPCDADDDLKLVRLIINAVGVFLNALFSSLNMGYTYRMHFEFETKYFELSQDISYILMRDRDFRPPADTVMMEVRERRKKLANAPEQVGKKFFGC
jgi:hypothetical protein